MNERDSVLEVRDLLVERGGMVILDVPHLSIRPGEIVSFIGPNGAGKTTLLEAVSYLLRPSRGEIFFKGEKMNANRSAVAYRRKLAMVFQEPLLFDTTVFENVASGLRIRRMEKERARRIVMQQLDRFGIAHLSQRSARKISGGEAQRTSLARAFALQPEVLLLDEPFSSLDPPTRESLIEDLEAVLRETGTTTLFTTHDRQEALRLSDRVAVIHQGKILQIGAPEELMNRPADECVASFVGVETLLRGRVIRQSEGTFTVSVFGYEIEVVGNAQLGDEIVLGIRPEQVTLTAHPLRERTSARNLFLGTIEKIVSTGLYRKVQLNCGFPLTAHVTHQSAEDLSLREGRMVMASVKATSIQVIRRKAPPGLEAATEGKGNRV